VRLRGLGYRAALLALTRMLERKLDERLPGGQVDVGRDVEK
jgi:hypothetical protein